MLFLVPKFKTLEVFFFPSIKPWQFPLKEFNYLLLKLNQNLIDNYQYEFRSCVHELFVFNSNESKLIKTAASVIRDYFVPNIQTLVVTKIGFLPIIFILLVKGLSKWASNFVSICIISMFTPGL